MNILLPSSWFRKAALVMVIASLPHMQRTQFSQELGSPPQLTVGCVPCTRSLYYLETPRFWESAGLPLCIDRTEGSHYFNLRSLVRGWGFDNVWHR